MGKGKLPATSESICVAVMVTRVTFPYTYTLHTETALAASNKQLPFSTLQWLNISY